MARVGTFLSLSLSFPSALLCSNIPRHTDSCRPSQNQVNQVVQSVSLAQLILCNASVSTYHRNMRDAGQDRVGQGVAGQGLAGQDREGQGRAGQDRTWAGQGGAGQDRTGKGRRAKDRAGEERKGQGRAGEKRKGQAGTHGAPRNAGTGW